MNEQASPEQNTYKHRCELAKTTQVGDVWSKRKNPKHFAEVLGRPPGSNWTLILRHWNGRVTRKWYSYLASEYDLTKPVERTS